MRTREAEAGELCSCCSRRAGALGKLGQPLGASEFPSAVTSCLLLLQSPGTGLPSRLPASPRCRKPSLAPSKVVLGVPEEFLHSPQIRAGGPTSFSDLTGRFLSSVCHSLSVGVFQASFFLLKPLPCKPGDRPNSQNSQTLTETWLWS